MIELNNSACEGCAGASRVADGGLPVRAGGGVSVASGGGFGIPALVTFLSYTHGCLEHAPFGIAVRPEQHAGTNTLRASIERETRFPEHARIRGPTEFARPLPGL
jgi:hypothetical protein